MCQSKVGLFEKSPGTFSKRLIRRIQSPQSASPVSAVTVEGNFVEVEAASPGLVPEDVGGLGARDLAQSVLVDIVRRVTVMP